MLKHVCCNTKISQGAVLSSTKIEAICNYIQQRMGINDGGMFLLTDVEQKAGYCGSNIIVLL